MDRLRAVSRCSAVGLAGLACLAYLACLGLPAQALASTAPEFDQAARLAMTRQYPEALAQYQEFLKRNPQDRLAPVAALAAANLQLLAAHDTTAALEHLERVLQDYGGSPYALQATVQKGACLEARKEWERAASAYESGLEMGLASKEEIPSGRLIDLAVSAARSYERAGSHERANTVYLKILRQNPPPEVKATALTRVGEGLEELGNLSGAATNYARVVMEFPSSAVWPQVVAKQALIDKHVKLNWPPILSYAAGSRYIARGDFDSALVMVGRVETQGAGPDLRECNEYRKITLETTLSGDYTEGCKRMRAYLEKYPKGLQSALAKQTLDTRYSPIADLEKEVKERPEDADALQGLGQAYLQARAANRAIETLEKALSLRPDLVDTHLLLGYAYNTAGRSEDAVKHFSAYLERNPEDLTSLNMIGYAYLGQNQPEQAIPYFERYAKLAPGEANAHDSLGEGLLRAGRIEEAAAEYEKALSCDPNFTNSLFMLGDVYTRLHQASKAIQAYERFLELIPPNSTFSLRQNPRSRFPC